MNRIIAMLISLSVLAGVAMPLGAQTKDDEDAGNYWKQQERRLP